MSQLIHKMRPVRLEKDEFSAPFLRPIIKQGLLEGTCISLFGDPGVGKTIFCQSMAKNLLEDDVVVLYVTTDRSPQDLRLDFRMHEIDVQAKEKERKFAFVDGYSWLTGMSTEVFSAQNLANLSELIITIDKALNCFDDRIFVVVDSVSPLPLYNPEIDVTKFMQLLISKIRTKKGLGLFVVQSGVHTKEFCNALSYLSDGVFDLKVEEGHEGFKRFFRVRNLRYSNHDTRWFPLSVTSGDITLLSQEA